MKGKFAVKPLAAIRRQPIRLDLGIEAELKAIAQSWLNVPIHPIIVRPDLTLADGHRRVAGLELLGVKDVEVFITDEDLTDDQLVGNRPALRRTPQGPERLRARPGYEADRRCAS